MGCQEDSEKFLLFDRRATDARHSAILDTYDNLGRTATMTARDPDGGGSLTSAVTTYTYGSRRLDSVTIAGPRRNGRQPRGKRHHEQNRLGIANTDLQRRRIGLVNLTRVTFAAQISCGMEHRLQKFCIVNPQNMSKYCSYDSAKRARKHSPFIRWYADTNSLYSSLFSWQPKSVRLGSCFRNMFQTYNGRSDTLLYEIVICLDA